MTRIAGPPQEGQGASATPTGPLAEGGAASASPAKPSVPSAVKPAPTHYCSFCGKSQHEVLCLIVGPTVFICNECTTLCGEIAEQHRIAKIIREELADIPGLASAIEAREGGNEVPSRSDESAVPERQTPNTTPSSQEPSQ